MKFIKVELNKDAFKKNPKEPTERYEYKHDKPQKRRKIKKKNKNSQTEFGNPSSDNNKCQGCARNCTCFKCLKCKACKCFSDACSLSLKSRSEVMFLCQLFMDRDALFPTIAELGRLCLVQLDRPSLNSKYDSHINMCTAMEKILNNFIKELTINDIATKQKIDDIIEPIIPNSPSELDRIYHQLTQINDNYHEIIKYIKPLETNYYELRDYSVAIEHLFKFMDQEDNDSLSSRIQLNNVVYDDFRFLDYIVGTIRREKVFQFEKALFRFCPRAYYFKSKDIENVNFKDKYPKILKALPDRCAFFIFFLGEKIRTKIEKICKGYDTSLYYCPRDDTERKLLLEEIMNKKRDLKRIVMRSHQRKLKILIDNAEEFHPWLTKTLVMKSIFVVCNSLRLDVTRNVYVAELWVARQDYRKVQIAINTATLNAGHTVLPMMIKIKATNNPPTYYKTNKFTRGFQNIIDAYGCAMYREVSPTPYTIITFPFLFSVMFGDIGHGLIIFLTGLALILIEKKYEKKKILNEIYRIIFAGRYIILLLGLFSIYAGFMYNEIFAKPINFGSRWKINLDDYQEKIKKRDELIDIDPKLSYERTPTPFGFDAIWALATNKIIVNNSFKMKISIIFGVIQMLFGLVLRGINASYFKNKLSILLEVIPMALFLLAIFGYLIILVIIKWFLYSAVYDPPKNPPCAPSILVTVLDMVMFKDSNKLPEGCPKFIFNGQKVLQVALVCIAFISVPILLLGKPIEVCCKRHFKKKLPSQVSIEEPRPSKEPRKSTPVYAYVGRQSTLYSMKSVLLRENVVSNITFLPEDLNEDHEEMSEVMIYQGIHTIDSVIGSVSHTASYLRLWALSLAHSQMSEVMWVMIFKRALAIEKSFFRIKNIIFIVIFHAVWAVFTVLILVVMEGLSVFLHALRLHWVEFQSKFYFGTGDVFLPFCFHNILNEY